MHRSGGRGRVVSRRGSGGRAAGGWAQCWWAGRRRGWCGPAGRGRSGPGGRRCFEMAGGGVAGWRWGRCPGVFAGRVGGGRAVRGRGPCGPVAGWRSRAVRRSGRLAARAGSPAVRGPVVGCCHFAGRECGRVAQDLALCGRGCCPGIAAGRAVGNLVVRGPIVGWHGPVWRRPVAWRVTLGSRSLRPPGAGQGRIRRCLARRRPAGVPFHLTHRGSSMVHGRAFGSPPRARRAGRGTPAVPLPGAGRAGR